jgi:hypothetical protein
MEDEPKRQESVQPFFALPCTIDGINIINHNMIRKIGGDILCQLEVGRLDSVRTSFRVILTVIIINHTLLLSCLLSISHLQYVMGNNLF